MVYLLISVVLLAVFFSLFKNPIKNSIVLTRLVQGVVFIAVLFFLTLPSYVIVDADEVGHLKRKFLASELPAGNIIAANGEKGPQARILGPGFHFEFLIRVLNDVEYFPVVNIPEGHYGLIEARDGLPLRNEQFMADPWPEKQFSDMLDAHYFLTEGKGQKGRIGK